mgnify:CR=1 FL=1
MGSTRGLLLLELEVAMAPIEGYFIRLMYNSKYDRQVKEIVSESKPGH